MYHVPMCVVCGEQEIGFEGSMEVCSAPCRDEVQEFLRGTCDELAARHDVYEADEVGGLILVGLD